MLLHVAGIHLFLLLSHFPFQENTTTSLSTDLLIVILEFKTILS